ncbi:MAG: hypothetical protein ACRD97_06690 [Nitrososphaeraceae archaeon]
MINDIEPLVNNNLNSDELIKKINLLLEQVEATQRAIAHLRKGLPEIIREAIKAILKERAARGFLP